MTSSAKRFSGEYSLRESMDLLLIGRKRLIKWAKKGLLPFRREGLEWFFLWDDLIHFAFHNCLECGEPKQLIEEELYFCFSCGSFFSPNPDKELPIELFGSISEVRLSFFFQRMEEETEDTTIIALLQKQFDLSPMQAHRVWFQHTRGEEGLIQIGLADGVYEQAKEELGI